jgi:DNA processing protein
MTGNNHDMAEPDTATYLYALGLLPGIGPKALRRIARAFPQPIEVLEVTAAVFAERLGPALAKTLSAGLASTWATAWQRACAVTVRHRARGIYELALSDPDYPALLRLIDDPPVILYVDGRVEALQLTDAVAVVGTREPTPRGRTVARRVALHFAAQGYVIVHGLATGIDTAGASGALDAQGVTIAVLGSGLDDIYPPENEELARRITASGGALISEYPLGQRVFKGGFVQRDRIQAGLSLAVVVIQTEREGGTMHTVRFAEQYGRQVLCPQPLADEATAPAYEGIWQLVQEQRAQLFHRGDYERIARELAEAKQRIVARQPGQLSQTGPSARDKRRGGRV